MGQEIGEAALNTGATSFPVCAMRYVPIREQHLATLACDRDAWRARAKGSFDVESLKACVPDAATCDPSVVADAIREWFDSFDDGIPTWRLSSQDR